MVRSSEEASKWNSKPSKRCAFALSNLPWQTLRLAGTLIEQIVTRLNEYADWCEGHYHELHESLLTHARGQSIPTHSAPKAKRARLRDIDTVNLPIFGKIPAGFPQDLDESPSTTRLMRVRRGRFPEGAFGLEVRGDSMNTAKGKFGQIKDGEIVVLLPPGLRELQHGDVVAALCDGQTTLKRLDCCLGPKCVLRAESDQPTWQHGITPVHDLSIQGVMIGKL